MLHTCVRVHCTSKSRVRACVCVCVCSEMSGLVILVSIKCWKQNLIKSTIFWDITPCSPLNVNRRFGGTYRLHLQGRRILSYGRASRNWVTFPSCFLYNPKFLLADCSACHLVSCLSYSLTLKMEQLCSSETSVDIQGTTWRYTPEDGTLHNRRCENPKVKVKLSL
jgi:hypothetical protein